jgi:hypothetical protein
VLKAVRRIYATKPRKACAGNAQAFFICRADLTPEQNFSADEFIGIIVLEGRCFRIAQIWHNQRPCPHEAVVLLDLTC